MKSIYLAGAIRDGVLEDFDWRTDVRYALQCQFNILDPMEGKAYDVNTGWTMHGAPSTTDVLVPRDVAMIHRSDALLANLLPMKTGYPSIGTLMELGIALERRLLTVVVGDPKVLGHPFIQRVAYRRVETIDEAIDWLMAESKWL